MERMFWASAFLVLIVVLAGLAKDWFPRSLAVDVAIGEDPHFQVKKDGEPWPAK